MVRTSPHSSRMPSKTMNTVDGVFAEPTFADGVRRACANRGVGLQHRHDAECLLLTIEVGGGFTLLTQPCGLLTIQLDALVGGAFLLLELLTLQVVEESLPSSRFTLRQEVEQAFVAAAPGLVNGSLSAMSECPSD